ncbi:MAG TPA: hypothetical protein VGV16_04140 [Gammaproteobacteria bacterium]|nr:hypothetical protein [Gammaproteobacteria bacterium]
MAEILIFLAELLVEILAGVASSRSTYRFEKREHNLTPLKCLLLFVAGLILGGLWWWYAPHLLIRSPWLRALNLLVAPLLSGYAAHTLARLRQERELWTVRPERHFWYGLSACVGLVTVRLLLGLWG